MQYAINRKQPTCQCCEFGPVATVVHSVQTRNGPEPMHSCKVCLESGALAQFALMIDGYKVLSTMAFMTNTILTAIEDRSPVR